LVRVDAIKTYDGFVEINKNWDSVDDFNRFKNSNEGRCYKYFTGGNLLTNVLVGFPDFHRYNDKGVLVPVDVDSYVRFKCKKR
jgi:hypothetical protein